MFGHSLGGALAGKSGSKGNITTYNKGVGLGDIGKAIPKNQTDIRTTRDPVSIISNLQKYNGNLKEIQSPQTQGLLEAHNLNNLWWLCMNELIVESKKFNLSTRGSSCRILNENIDFKSYCEYNIPNMIIRDESIEFIQFSVPDAVIPVSFYVVNENNSNLDISMNGITTTYIFPYGNYQANYFISTF